MPLDNQTRAEEEVFGRLGLLVISLLVWSGGWVGAGGMGVKTKPSPA